MGKAVMNNRLDGSLRTAVLKAIIYLWTRDAKLAVDDHTESYVLQHLDHLLLSPGLIRRLQESSDEQRADMASRIVDRWMGKAVK